MDLNGQQLQARLDALEQQYQCATRRLKLQTGLAAITVVAAILLSPAGRTALAQPTAWAQPAVDPVIRRLIALEAKTQFMTTNAASRSTVFSGCNVFINNGLGATNGLPADPLNITPSQTRTNGLGNLIVGYNESRSLWGDHDVRTGSHNIIVGQLQDFSSYGGLVAGAGNSISGAYASASGGDANNVTGDFASISGGESNVASGMVASISGGQQNTASGLFASISAGNSNLASATDASVSGGGANRATGPSSSVSGGAFNFASGFNSSISGGQSNRAGNAGSSISGGTTIIQANPSGWSAGSFHTP